MGSSGSREGGAEDGQRMSGHRAEAAGAGANPPADTRLQQQGLHSRHLHTFPPFFPQITFETLSRRFPLPPPRSWLDSEQRPEFVDSIGRLRAMARGEASPAAAAAVAAPAAKPPTGRGPPTLDPVARTLSASSSGEARSAAGSPAVSAPADPLAV